MQVGADRDADRDGDAANEADAHAEPGTDRDADIGYEVERIPLRQKIGMGVEPQLQPVRAVGDLQPGSGHDAGVGQGKIGFTLDVDDAEQVPAEAKARHDGIFRAGLEGRMVTAQGEQELRLLEPHEEGKAASQLAIMGE
jgi:hypothetical protein